METIKDIVAEMRAIGRLDEKSTDKIPRSHQALGLRTYADRIEKAVTNCNQLKLREALKQAQRVLHCAIVAEILKGEDAHKALNVVANALSEPPRNCDLYATPKEAGEAFISESCENPCGNCTVSDECHNPLIHECGINWLFAEAKGEAK